MQFQIGKLSYNAKLTEQIPKEMFSASTMADSALYTNYNVPYYNPDALYQKHGNYDLFDEMREDDQVGAVLKLFKYLIIGAQWTIECEHEEAKEFIIENFNSMDEIFASMLFRMLSCMDYGFSLTEVILKEEDGKIKLDKLKTRMPHNFEFVLDDYGNVTDIIQTVTGKPIHLSPEKFIHFTYQGEWDNPYGRSALDRGVYRAYWSKNAIIKFWNIYLERHGMPFGMGTYPKTAGQGQINDLKEIGKNIQSKTFGVFPEGFAIDFKEASKGTDNYERAIDKHNMSIARALLVPDLLGLSGGATGGGSYSLGQEQFDLFYTIVDYVRKQLERRVSQKIAEPLAYYNFGSDIPVKFVFNAIDKQEKEQMLNLWLQAVNGGKIPTTDVHTNWFLKSIDAPEIEQEELDEINAKKEEVANEIRGGQDTGNKEEPEKEKAKSTEKKLTYSTYEKKVDFAKIEKELDAIEAKYKDELGKLYKLAINGLVDDIKRRNIIEKKRFDLINKLDLRHQAKIQKTTSDMLKESLFSGYGTVQKNYLIDDPLVLDDEEIAEWVKSYSGYTTNAEAEFILNKTKPALIEGIRSGASTKEIMAMVDNALQGYDLNLDAHRIETLVRTVTSTGYNEGRLQQFGSISDQIQAYEFSAVLDGRTSALCESLNGKILKPNEVNTYNPPLHFNCRSLLVPIFIDEKFDGEFNIPPVKSTQGNFVELV